MKKTDLSFFVILILSLLLSSCLQEREKASTVSSLSSWFDGVVSAKNMGGYPSSVKVSWNPSSIPVTAYRIYSLQYDETTKNNAWTEIDEVNSDTTSYIHSDLSAGQIYSYMVRAVDSNDKEDTNNKQVSTVAFDGIASVRTTGKTTATVSLNTSTGAFDEVRVYAQPSRGGSKNLVATIKGNVGSINVTGLHSGVKYKFSVAAYMNYLSAEDGNEVYLEAQTYSDSFGSGSTTDTDYNYRGMMSVQAFGDAPHAPASPQARLVRLTWPAFAGAVSSTKYRVVRASTSYTVDLTTSTSCTSVVPVASSCIVNCSVSGSGTQTCTDSDVGPAPVTYNYAVALVKTDPDNGEEWVEELPSTNASDYYTKVQVPPDYMVLVQRDAANYEMCNLMGVTSNPRKHQRCSYTGIGATPYNSGPGKPALTFDSGYYDFGYNLFVDRYRLACNWTRNSSSCGPNGCVGITGNSSGAQPPSSTLGNVGDVFFALNPSWGANCYYKTSGGWVTTPTLTDPNQIRSATTIDPGADGDKHNPEIAGMSPLQSFTMCSAQSTSYGNKRLLRRREIVHASAFSSLPGEPNAITSVNLLSLLRFGNYSSSTNTGGQVDGYQRCPNSSQSYLLTIPTTVTDLLTATNTRSQLPNTLTGSPGVLNAEGSPYFIGTSATANCVSRWGTQEPISNSTFDGSNTALSDSFVRTSSQTTWPITYVPVASDYDSGVVYDWGSYAFDGIAGPALGNSTTWTVSAELNATNAVTYPRFILPLGVPLITNNSTYRSTMDLVYNGALGGSAFGTNSNAIMDHVYDNYTGSSGNTLRFIMMEGAYNRFSYTIHMDSSSVRFKSWCAEEAE